MSERSSDMRPNGRCNSPIHIAIIMDGNGRWASARSMPRTYGHKQGVSAVRRVVRASIELDVKYLTLYSFSSENWSRPKSEINDLMGLLKLFIKKDLADLHKNNVRIKIIGDPFAAGNDIAELMNDAVQLTADNSGLNLIIAFSYGSRDEIIRATRNIVDKVNAGELSPDAIDCAVFERNLDTSGIPDPDLLIRTSGEKRLSNFLLWQCAYSEFVFQDVHWPDYNKEHLQAAIDEYQGRNRRYGGLEKGSMAYDKPTSCKSYRA